MTFSKTILAVRLLCFSALAAGILSFAQAPGSESTSDLESQPNTNNYPGRRGDVPQSNSQANANPRQQVPSQNGLANSAGANQRPNSQNPGPQNHPFIGPPAPPPPTPEQMAPAPPKVTYENGLLSVESVNSRLTDVLHAIRSKASIQIEGIPGPSDKDRVAGRFGPAPADEVLTSLLRGSRFDYVIVGMADNPSLVQRVILTPISGSITAVSPASKPPQDTSGDDEENSNDDSSAETPEPGQTPTAAQQGDAAPRSVEQLREELQRMQQREQGNPTQQQNPPNQQNAPNQTPPH